MKVAIAVYNNRISPVFDASKNVLVLDIENQHVGSKQVETFSGDSPVQKVFRLSELGVEELICGAVSTDLAHLLDTHGIKIIPFTAGELEEVLSAYLNHGLPDPKLRMPGYSAMGKKGT